MASRLVHQATAFSVSSRKRQKVRNGDFLSFVRSLPCVITGSYPAEAAHVSFKDARYGKTGRGLGQKESDCWCVPLSHDQHMLQHGMPEREFWELAGIDPCRVAASLFICFQTEDRDSALLVLQHAREA